MKNDTIGVDVSKDHLDAHRLADGATRRFANTKGGHKALIKWLTETPLYRVVFEPTGPYHRAVERALGIAGVPFVKVNPRQARRFAEATGKLAKTDRLDAAILARMGAMLELEARPARSELLLELKELYVAREALVKDRTAAKNRGKLDALAVETSECSAPRTDRSPDRDSRSGHSPDYRSKREPRRSLRHPDQHSRRIQHHRLCLADRNARTRRSRSRTGRQPRRLGRISRRQSGRWTGNRSFIRGGRADVRQALYMPALVAARFNPDMKTKYAHHRNRKAGKGRPNRNHAKARRPRKCPPQGQSPLDAKNRLINTDTLAMHYSLARAAGS